MEDEESRLGLRATPERSAPRGRDRPAAPRPAGEDAVGLTTPRPSGAPVAGSPADDAVREQRLTAMKRRATGLLVAFGAVFIVTRLLEPRWPWLGFVRATAEAAMVGGLADWFAVTALFRHPMRIPIPHTAIIPARKDRIGRTLGRFVQNNFLSREVIAVRVAAMHPGERLARWLAEPAHSRLIARHVAAGLGGAAKVLRDDEVGAMIERGLRARVRRIQVAPLLGNVLTIMTADRRHQELLDEALRLTARALAENEEMIRQRIREESPWWLPEAVDDRIHEKILAAVERTLQQVSEDPVHPLRARFDEALARFIEQLRTSPEAMQRAEAIKEDVLAHPALRDFSASLWTDAKEALARRIEGPERTEPDAIERGLVTLAETVLADPALVDKVDRWIVDALVYAVDQYRDEVGELIEHTVGQWDPDATSHKIELQIGRDLQFIRINGTLVGGLVGLVLYTASRFF
jgi:uncharacterized membrane-anchored protein YjiN (DUF445 family)